jgi:thioredoxin reductase (NADPH)
MENKIYDTVIIGGGPAGLSAAQYTARAGLTTLVIDKNPLAGALGSTSKIENYPGVPKKMTGPELLNIFREQAAAFGAEIVKDQVYGVDFSGEEKKIITGDGGYSAKTVIIATGSMGRKPSIPGEEAFTGRGVSYCATCDAPFFKGREVAMAGSLDEIFEEIGSVLKFVSKIYLITNAKEVKPEMLDELKANPSVELMTASRIKEITGTAAVEKIIVEGPGGTKEIAVPAVFLYLHGNKAIIDFLYDSVKASDEGCLCVNHEDMSTSIEGVFAAGDVSCRKVRQVVLATAEGCLAALSAEKFINRRSGFKAQWS